MSLAAKVRRLEAEYGDLLASHEKARDLSDFSRYADDPIGFIREVLRETDPGAWSAQEDIAEAVRKNPLVVVRSCNSAGKDWIAGRLALWWAYAKRGLVLITGPTERQVREVVMGEVTRAWTRTPDLPGELYASALRLGPGEKAGILAFTSTEASRLTGFHAPLVMAIITEAQDVQDFAWEGFLACATGPEDRILAVGNPLAPVGRFFAVSQARSAWKALRIAASDHPNVREDRQVIPGGISRAFVERMAREYGEDSPIYTARVDAEFPDTAVSGLIKRSWLNKAAELHADPAFRRENRWGRVLLSVDVARHGPDATCLLTMRGAVVESIDIWRGLGLMQTTGRVVQAARELRQRESVRRHRTRREFNPASWPERIVVDLPGMGGGVVDRLREVGEKVLAFNGAERARRAERFANRRAESFWALREALQKEELALPPDEGLHEELLAIEWAVNSAGRVQIEAKDDIRSRIGRSPDKADALAIAVWSRTSVRVPTTDKPLHY